MAKVEIDTPSVTIRIDDPDANSDVLAGRALALYRETTTHDRQTSPGPANGLQAERRSTGNLGFGTWHHEAKPPEAQETRP